MSIDAIKKLLERQEALTNLVTDLGDALKRMKDNNGRARGVSDMVFVSLKPGLGKLVNVQVELDDVLELVEAKLERARSALAELNDKIATMATLTGD
jgi:prefoldin subunit 5